MAAALVVNPNTVAKAYRELERAGLAAARPGQGTFVIGSPEQVPAAVHARLAARLRTWVRGAHEAGLAPDQVRALVSSVLDEPQPQARTRAGAA